MIDSIRTVRCRANAGIAQAQAELAAMYETMPAQRGVCETILLDAWSSAII